MKKFQFIEATENEYFQCFYLQIFLHCIFTVSLDFPSVKLIKLGQHVTDFFLENSISVN